MKTIACACGKTNVVVPDYVTITISCTWCPKPDDPPARPALKLVK